MKTLASGLNTTINAEVQTLAMCYKATLADGTIRGFTTHDRDLVIDGITYVAATGFDPTQIRAMASMGVDGLDLSGAAVSPAISTQAMMEAYWDGAELEVFEVDYTQPAVGTNKLRTGWIGNIETAGLGFKAEMRGLMHKLQQMTGRVVQEMCDADFTDTRCGLDDATYTVTGSATSVTSRRVFGDTTRTELDGVYTYGILTWTTGNNDGLSSAVKNYITGEIELVESMPRAITVGDEYSMLKGCSKTRDACVAYSNIVNFRGFPEVPTPNSVSEGP
jgi:uncharacterized phage protein (TIGR02218 family)